MSESGKTKVASKKPPLTKEPVVSEPVLIEDPAPSNPVKEFKDAGTDLQECDSLEPRKSGRQRTLTEKGRELQIKKLKGFLYTFDCVYEHWKFQLKRTKKAVINNAPIDDLQEYVDAVEKDINELNNIYEGYRKIDCPTNEMRCRLDKCNIVSKHVIKNAQSQIQGLEAELDWPEVSSVFSSVSSISLPASNGSNQTLNLQIDNPDHSRQEDNKGQAEVEFSATQAVLKIMTEQEEKQEKLRQLEAKAAAMQEERENAQRNIEHLEELKKLYATKANLKVHGQHQVVSQHTVQQPPPAKPHSVPADNTASLVKILAEAITANRLPIPEPPIFTGDPLKFNLWKASFQTLIERKNIPTVEKIFFLQNYVGGVAKEAIEGYFLSDTEESYLAAWDLLNERYGDSFIIAKAFRDKLHAWPRIAPRDSVELRRFVDFLRSCEVALAQNVHLKVLNDAMENQFLITKLPDWLMNGWNRAATQYQLLYRNFPNFSYFVTFLNQEASIACNPVTSYNALQQCEQVKSRPKNPSPHARTFTTSVSERSTTCLYCNRTGHGLHDCYKFTALPMDDRVKFVQHERLCFGCLTPGHLSKDCSDRMVCDKCSKRHPTCLHENRSNQGPNREFRAHSGSKEERTDSTQSNITETISNRVVQEDNDNQTSAIVPVYVSNPDNSKEVMVYALLDTQSDSSFILEQVADVLDAPAEVVKLKLSTMASRGALMNCKRLENLTVRGLFSSKQITVPKMYTSEFIPANRSHIPTPETAKAWPHLEYLSEQIAPKQDCEVGLLIGYNCIQH